MKWDQYRSIMELYAIKNDDMATEDAYFIEFENSNNGSYRILVYGLKA